MMALRQSDFGSSWFAQRRLACAVESRLWCAARDAADTNLDARNNGCIRDSHIGIYSWACLEEKVRTVQVEDCESHRRFNWWR